MKNSFLRNVKNISRVALFNISVALFTLMAIILFQVLMSGDNIVSLIKERLQFFYIYMCTFSVFVYNVRLSTIDVPVIMSFCSRRKDYLAAKYVINAIIIMMLTGIKLCLDIYINGGYKPDNIILTAALLIVIWGIVNIIGIVIIKYGRIGYIIFVLACGILGGTISFLASEDTKGIISGIMNISGASLAVSVVFVVISIAVEGRMLLNSDIKW